MYIVDFTMYILLWKVDKVDIVDVVDRYIVVSTHSYIVDKLIV